MKKMYFFTKNAPAYQYITLGMVLSCTILIEVIALPFSYSVSYKYQNIISILSSISTGYIRACLETHLSIMKRFNSMLAMAI